MTRPALSGQGHAPSHTEAFDAWTTQLASAKDFDPEKSASYRLIWNKWARFLAGQETPWAFATPVQVVHFLHHDIEPVKPVNGAGEPRPVSEVTRRRYFRVLTRIYQFAQHQGWIALNPAAGLAIADRPPSEDPKGAVLMPSLWAALPGFFRDDDKRGMGNVRDAAMLWLLYDSAITPEELRGLLVSDVLFGPPFEGHRVCDEVCQPWDAAVTMSATVCLAVQGGRGQHQSRILPLTVRAANALQAWLAQRPEVLDAANQRMPANWLFFTNRLMPLSAVGLLQVVTKTISRAYIGAGLSPPARCGPQVMRNTRMVMALESGMAVGDVLRCAGLRDIRGLAHLRACLRAGILVEDHPAP